MVKINKKLSIFSIRLRELRRSKKIRQEKLAEVIGFGYTAVSNYESGRNEPSIDVLIKLADYFNVTLDYLVGRVDFNNIQEMSNDMIFMQQMFQQLDQDEKNAIITIARLFIENKQKQENQGWKF